MPRGDERAVKLVSPEARVTNFSQLPGTSQVLALDVLHPRKTRAVDTLQRQSSFAILVEFSMCYLNCALGLYLI